MGNLSNYCIKSFFSCEKQYINKFISSEITPSKYLYVSQAQR